MHKKQLKIINKLIEIAQKVTMRCKNAAAIVNNNQIISYGYNYQIPRKKHKKKKWLLYSTR